MAPTWTTNSGPNSSLRAWTSSAPLNEFTFRVLKPRLPTLPKKLVDVVEMDVECDSEMRHQVEVEIDEVTEEINEETEKSIHRSGGVGRGLK